MEEKLKIMKEFERKEKQIETKIKMYKLLHFKWLIRINYFRSAYSNELNQSRLQTLKARDEGIQKLYSDAHKALTAICKDVPKYKKLLHDLIVQVRTQNSTLSTKINSLNRF